MNSLAREKLPEPVEKYNLTIDRSQGVISRYVENLKKILGESGISGFINDVNYPLPTKRGQQRFEQVEFEIHPASKFCYSDGTVDFDRVKRNSEMLLFPDPAEALLVLGEILRLGKDHHLYLAYLAGQHTNSKDLFYLDRRQVKESFRITDVRGFYSRVVLVRR